MKSKRPANRRKQNPAITLAPRLAAYSATAAAALAFAPNDAHAQVTLITTFDYSSQTNTTTPPSFNLPAGGGNLSFMAGSLEFAFFGQGVYARSSGNGGHAFLEAFNYAGIAIGEGVAALKLGLGSAIKPQTNFGGEAILALRNPINTLVAYKFNPSPNGAVTGYVGFKNSNAGHNYYGWLNVKVTGDANGFPTSVSLVAKNGDPGVFGAYDISTDPNIGTFGAGDITSVPEPADSAFGLGLLAFGAAGVRELRRRRKQAA